jgi:hypothetical protein
MLILFVLNNFIKKRLTAKSNEFKSDLFNGQASVPYNNIGKHFCATNWIITSSEANLPILPNMALSDL